MQTRTLGRTDLRVSEITLGTWGLASIAMIAGGIILIFFPGNQETASDPTIAGIILLVVGLISGGLMQITVAPLLGEAIKRIHHDESISEIFQGV